MLTGITDDLMKEGKKQCEEKFKQDLLDVWKDAAEYKIKTYDDFANELRMLNDRYVDEMEDFEDFCFRYGLAPENVMYFGDDLPDIPVMVACGCGVCPADAVDEVKEIADIVSDRPGGRGCARAAIEAVMKYQGTWQLDIQYYKSKF